MPTPDDILAEALAVQSKDDLSEHLGTIFTLRSKHFTWREIAAFLTERGVVAEHTKLLRAYTKHMSMTMDIPTADAYKAGLETVGLDEKQRRMLECHYKAHNRTVTYTELAASAGSASYRTANTAYGTLGRKLGEAVGYHFVVAPDRGEPFYSSAIGIDAPKSISGEYRMMMHHELAKAIQKLGWFQ